jgi:hypothetical protein
MDLINLLVLIFQFQLTLRTKDVKKTVSALDDLLREKNKALLTAALTKKLVAFRSALKSKGSSFDNDKMIMSVLNGVTTRNLALLKKFNSQASK